MSDLISRKKVIDILEKEKSLRCSYDADITIFSIEKGIRELPTTYSVDKFVEELEETMQDLSVIEIFSHIDFDSTIQSELDNFLKAYNSELLRIVKHGGVGTETETIRDKAVKWNNNSSKRVPYEFIDYVEGKREIGVSDDVCEWKYNDSEYYFESSCKHLHIFMSDGPKENEYEFCPYCGKKIKVVE